MTPTCCDVLGDDPWQRSDANCSSGLYIFKKLLVVFTSVQCLAVSVASVRKTSTAHQIAFVALIMTLLKPEAYPAKQ